MSSFQPKNTQSVPSLTTSALIAVATIFPILSLLAIFLRYRARNVGRQDLKTDDWFILISWFISLGLSINSWVFGALTGLNTYKVDPIKGTLLSNQCMFIHGLILHPALTTVKISILFFYKRIFAISQFVYVAWIGMIVMTCWGIAFFVMLLLQVDPISGAWTGQGRFRLDTTSLGLAQAGSSIALDLLVLILPLPVVWRLRMQTQRKVGVMIIFWLGGFCCVAAIVRLVLIKEALSRVVDSAADGFNLVYLEAKVYIFAVIEPNCSIIAACLPCYGPLMKGGRAPESIIASVRSVISLFSLGSQGSRHSSRRNRPKLAADDHDRQAVPNIPPSDSQIELTEYTSDVPGDPGRRDTSPHDGNDIGTRTDNSYNA